jgi:hypothetical protein
MNRGFGGRTWLLERDGLCDVLHENAALELQLWLPVFGD